MSAGVSDQRMKGQGNQVSNGPKEQLGAGEGASGSEEFEPWRSQQQNSAAHTAYGGSVPISSATDLYNMNTAGYYGSGGTYPYQAYGVGDGTWSNGTDPMTFLSGYPHDSYSMDGMFGPSTTFSTPTAFGQPSSFNYFPNNGDYNTWGSQLGGQRKYDDYYRDPQNMYTQAIPDSALKSVEQAMQSLDLKSSESTKESLGQAKKTTWASIASQPAKPQLTIQNQGLKKKGPGMPPGPIVPGKHNMDIGTWDTNKSTPPQLPQIINNTTPSGTQQKNLPPPPQPTTMNVRGAQAPPTWNGPPQTNRPLPPPPPNNSGMPRPQPPPQHPMQSYHPHHHHHHHPAAHHQPILPPHLQPAPPPPPPPPQVVPTNMQGLISGSGNGSGGGTMMTSQLSGGTIIQATTHPVLDELKGKNNYNPMEFDLQAPNARFFVIKSYSEDDIHRSIKYEIWCSTEHGNKRLDQAYRERDGNGSVYLFFSVNGSGHFCGMAQMVSYVDYNANSSVWSQDKWKGQFKVRWIYVKDVPNVQLRHIRLENNENKPVTNSRDTQEVPHPNGLQVLRIMHSYRHSTSIFDDFIHYEKRQEEEDNRKQPIHNNKDNNHHHQQQQQQQHTQHHNNHHHHHDNNTVGNNNNNNNNNTNHGHSGGREHRDRSDHNNRNRNNHQERDIDNHRQGGHRNNDHHGGHHKDRGDSNRGRGGRGGGGRN